MIDSIYGAESCQESDEEENAAEIEYRKVRQQIPSTIFPFVVHRWNCQPPRFDPDAAHKHYNDRCWTQIPSLVKRL